MDPWVRSLRRAPAAWRLVPSLLSAFALLFGPLRGCFGSECDSATSVKRKLASAECYAKQRNWQTALREVESYRHDFPESIPAVILNAQIYVELNALPDADSILRHALDRHLHSVELLVFFADLNEKAGDAAQSEQLLLEATKYSLNNPEVWRLLGDFYLEHGRSEAIHANQQAVRLDPNDSDSIAGLGSALAAAQNLAGARSRFQAAVLINSKSPHPSAIPEMRFGDYLYENDELEESLRHFDAALRIDPSSDDARMGRAKANVKMLRMEAARDDLVICEKDPARRLQALNLLLRVYQHEARSYDANQTAVEIERLAAQDNHDRLVGNQTAAELLTARGLVARSRFGEAVPLYESLLRSHPEAHAALPELAACYAKLDRLDDAESTLRQSLATQPESAVVQLALGRILLQEGNPEQARAYFQNAREADPLLTDAGLGIAASWMIEKKYTLALAELAGVKRTDPGSVPVHLMTAEALAKTGRPQGALLEIETVLKRDPNDSAALKMKQALSKNVH